MVLTICFSCVFCFALEPFDYGSGGMRLQFWALVHGSRYCSFVFVCGLERNQCVGSYFGIFPAFGVALCPFRETRGGGARQ